MGYCRSSVPQRFLPGRRELFFVFFAPGERPRCASLPARERLLGACGTRARQGAGRRRAAAPAWARSPEPGAQAPPFASPRAPSPLPPAPGEAAVKDSSSLGSGRTQRENGAKMVAGTGPHVGWKIADKGILERAEPRKAGLLPRTPRRGPRSRPSLCAWLKRSRMWGSFGFASVLTYTEIPALVSAARIPRRRLRVRWRCGTCRLGWGPARAGRGLLGCRHRTRSLRNGRARHPPPTPGDDRGPGPRRTPAPQGASARRPRLAGGGLSPAHRPECARGESPAALASLGYLLHPQPPPEKIF